MDKTIQLPDSNRFNFAMPVSFGELEWSSYDTASWKEKNWNPRFDRGEQLSDLFKDPVSFYAIASNNNPVTEGGWDLNYIGYESTSISEPNGFSDANLTDGPWLLENENGGTAHSPNFLSSLSESPSARPHHLEPPSVIMEFTQRIYHLMVRCHLTGSLGRASTTSGRWAWQKCFNG